MTGRCLVVANQTLGGDALDDAVKACMDRGLRRFYVMVPMTRIEHEAAGWGGGFGMSEGASPDVMRQAMEESARQREADLEETRRRAQHRFELMVEKIQTLGGEAVGEVRSEEPLEAVEAVLDQEAAFDEIIISTLPAGISRWLKMDLPNRVSRMTDIPVTTIEAAN